MSIPYDAFVGAFLSKITEFELLELAQGEREEAVNGYMKRAISRFKKVCKVDLTTTGNDAERMFDVDVPDGDVDELVDIISDGMVAQWLKPYVNHQELLENVMNTNKCSVLEKSSSIKPIELLEHPQSHIDYSIRMKHTEVRMFENYMDWAISSQAPNRGRFNDHLDAEQITSVIEVVGPILGEDMVCSLMKVRAE